MNNTDKYLQTIELIECRADENLKLPLCEAVLEVARRDADLPLTVFNSLYNTVYQKKAAPGAGNTEGGKEKQS